MTRLLFVAAGTVDLEDAVSELERTEMEITRVDTAITALKQLHSDSFDCVVSTTDLPDFDAIQFLRRVRDERPKLPTVLLIGREDVHLLNRAKSVGIRNILTYEQDLADEVVSQIRATTMDQQLEANRERDIRLKELVYQLTQRTGSASVASNVKRIACQMLASSELYTLAWVSEYDADTDRLVPEITAGIDVTHLSPRPRDDITWDSGVVITDFSDEDSYYEVAIPLGSDETLTGVLYLTTARQIDELERELLSELGTIIGALLQSGPLSQEVHSQVEEFSAIFAHELRNQLDIILDHLAQAREKTTYSFDQIETALERIEQIADEAATIARGTVDPDDLEPVELGEFAESVWASLESEAENTTLTVVDSKTVYMQPALLRHVFENLFRNSITHAGDFFRYEGDATLTTVVRVGTLENGFYVEDTGRGIPPEDRERVFQWGYTTNDDGDGIGLPLSKRFVEAHGWDVTVTESDEGGARFEITFDSGYAP